MANKTCIVYTAARSEDAHHLKNLMREAGIQADVINDALQAAIGDLPPGWSVSSRVVVAEDQAEAARNMALAFDAESIRAAHRVPVDEPEETATPHRPACPECGRNRTAVCPICRTSGAAFPAADQATPDDSGAAALIICPICDEPFTPGYLRQCEWCGHDFGEGLRLPAKARLEPIDSRLIGGLLALVAVLAAIWAYFATLLARP